MTTGIADGPARSLHLHGGMTSYRARKLLADKRGATMVEYAILLFVILVAASAVYTKIGKNVRMAGDMTRSQFVP